mmetsp:Transcript_69783/g.226972  ORF Transcript_69783/g.226972 Transcript_69783/m.226972 type:complete len:209 (+) Transcript_69783:603-1229(+)
MERICGVHGPQRPEGPAPCNEAAAADAVAVVGEDQPQDASDRREGHAHAVSDAAQNLGHAAATQAAARGVARILRHGLLQHGSKPRDDDGDQNSHEGRHHEGSFDRLLEDRAAINEIQPLRYATQRVGAASFTGECRANLEVPQMPTMPHSVEDIIDMTWLVGIVPSPPRQEEEAHDGKHADLGDSLNTQLQHQLVVPLVFLELVVTK